MYLEKFSPKFIKKIKKQLKLYIDESQLPRLTEFCHSLGISKHKLKELIKLASTGDLKYPQETYSDIEDIKELIKILNEKFSDVILVRGLFNKFNAKLVERNLEQLGELTPTKQLIETENKNINIDITQQIVDALDKKIFED
jgi:hypothetical protein